MLKSIAPNSWRRIGMWLSAALLASCIPAFLGYNAFWYSIMFCVLVVALTIWTFVVVIKDMQYIERTYMPGKAIVKARKRAEFWLKVKDWFSFKGI